MMESTVSLRRLPPRHVSHKSYTTQKNSALQSTIARVSLPHTDKSCARAKSTLHHANSTQRMFSKLQEIGNCIQELRKSASRIRSLEFEIFPHRGASVTVKKTSID